MATTVAKIQDQLARHNELITILNETNQAPAALNAQINHIRDLDETINNRTKQIQKLDEKRRKEFKEHESYRDSKVRKLAFRVSGKQEEFAARQDKEEQEYHQALQELNTAGDKQKESQRERTDALRIRNELEPQVARNRQAQHDIEVLYDSIFDAPAPDFPTAEQTKQVYRDAVHRHAEASKAAHRDEDVSRTLSSAQVTLQRAQAEMRSASDFSGMDVMGGGSMTDYMERRSLDQAMRLIDDANRTVREAQRQCPLVGSLPMVRIPGPSMGDVMFDNIFSDLAMHDKINEASRELDRCCMALQDQLRASNERRAKSEGDQSTRAQQLSMAKTDMLKARKAAFDQVAAGNGPGDSYHAFGGQAPPAFHDNGPAPNVPPKTSSSGGSYSHNNPFLSGNVPAAATSASSSPSPMPRSPSNAAPPFPPPKDNNPPDAPPPYSA